MARNERDRLIVRTLAETGMRRGELSALAPGDLVESRRQFFLQAHGKGGRDRQVAVTQQALGLTHVLEDVGGDDDVVRAFVINSLWKPTVKVSVNETVDARPNT